MKIHERLEGVMDAAMKAVRSQLPAIEKAVVTNDGDAGIALSIRFKHDEDTRDLNITVQCKSTLPGGHETFKSRIENGQLSLI